MRYKDTKEIKDNKKNSTELPEIRFMKTLNFSDIFLIFTRVLHIFLLLVRKGEAAEEKEEGIGHTSLNRTQSVWQIK